MAEPCEAQPRDYVEWTDPIEDDALASLELVLRAQVALVEDGGDPELVRHLDVSRSELEAFTGKWRA